MSQSEQTKQVDYIEPPMYQTAAAFTGQATCSLVCIQVTNTVTVIDLTSIAGSPGNQVYGADAAVVGGKNYNPIGHYLTMQGDSALNVFYAFGQTTAALSLLSTSTTATITNNQVTNSNNATAILPALQERNYKLPLGQNPASTATWGSSSPARYLGLLTSSGTATVRIWQSSP